MDRDDIIEALETTARSRWNGQMVSHCADAADIRLWRDRLLRFLEELASDLTVGEIVKILEDY